MKIKEITCKSALVKSNLPDSDYVINPYVGCAFGCEYCYASFMGRFVGEEISAWGKYVHAKVNIAEVLEKELLGKHKKRMGSSVFLSSVTDPYQGAEAKYKLTRQVLELLVKHKYSGFVGVLTKSGMVKRDIDLFKQLSQVEVGLTITSIDDNISKWLESGAPRASVRLQALAELNAAGISTYAFVGPLLPHFRYQAKNLRKVFKAISDAGTKEIYVEHINLKPYIKQRLMPVINKESAEIRNVYGGAGTKEHQQILTDMVMENLDKYNLKLKMAEVLLHK